MEPSFRLLVTSMNYNTVHGVFICQVTDFIWSIWQRKRGTLNKQMLQNSTIV